MAKVRCGLIMCQHNSKNTPAGYGTCMCQEKVKLAYVDDDHNDRGTVKCDHFHFLTGKCPRDGYDHPRVIKNRTAGKWEVA